MSLTVKPLQCEGNCESCYERRIRETGKSEYDFKKAHDRLKTEIESGAWENSPSVHGGEPLLIKTPELRQYLKTIFDKYGKSGIQTSLEKMKPAHIDIFERYKTHVGISLDGHIAYMNAGRMDCSLKERTRQKIIDGVLENMDILRDSGVNMSVIIVLRKYNAAPKKIGGLLNFLEILSDRYGIIDVRFNPVIAYDEVRRSHEELSGRELGAAFIKIAEMCLDNRTLKSKELQYLPIRDVVDMLLGYNRGTCIFGECDAWHTRAETTIMGDGELGNCLKSGGALDGVQNLRAANYSKERYFILQQIDQEHLGCKECEWWEVCKGGCPGAGEKNDWRNRTRYCEGWKGLFSYVKSRIKGLMPNIHTVDEFSNRVGSELCLHNLGPGGSSWERRKRTRVEEIQRIRLTTTDNSRQGYTDKHGDVPHGDHLDKAK